jgi:hypothetical protein
MQTSSVHCQLSALSAQCIVSSVHCQLSALHQHAACAAPCQHSAL